MANSDCSVSTDVNQWDPLNSKVFVYCHDYVRLAKDFKTLGFAVIYAGFDACGALKSLKHSMECLVVSEQWIGSQRLDELVLDLQGRRCKVVIRTSMPSINGAYRAAKLGIDGYLHHEATAAEVLECVNKLGGNGEGPPPRPVSLARAEWDYIQWALAHFEGNKSAAARFLGIRRTTLQRKLSKDAPR